MAASDWGKSRVTLRFPDKKRESELTRASRFVFAGRKRNPSLATDAGEALFLAKRGSRQIASHASFSGQKTGIGVNSRIPLRFCRTKAKSEFSEGPDAGETPFLADWVPHHKPSIKLTCSVFV